MLRTFPSLLLLLACAGRTLAAAPVDLLMALQHGQVTLQAKSTGGLGPANLLCRLQNPGKREITVQLAPGLHFRSADNDVQELLTYQTQLVVLAPGAIKQLRLQGFCMQRPRRSPGVNTAVALAGLAPAPLKGLSDSLAKYSDLAPEYGQMLVWGITERETPHPMWVARAQLRGARSLMSYASSQAGVAPAAVNEFGKNHPASPSIRTFSQNSNLVYQITKPQTVSLKMYDAAGKLRRTLIDKRRVTPGTLHYAFGVNQTVAHDAHPVYFVRLLDEAGQTLKEVRLDEQTTAATDVPQHQEFEFRFTLAKPVKQVHFRVRLADGTLVQDVLQRPYLPAGTFAFKLAFDHLYPPGTAFVARLESEAGQVYAQQPIPAADK
jgi:hypothetical protein